MPRNEPHAPTSRRTFLRTGTAAVIGAGLTRPRSARAAESLALSGGQATVTVPAKRHSEATRWPLFGDAEKKAVLEIMDLGSGGVYRENALFEKDWQAYHKANFVKSYMNGTSALASMFFAMDFPPGSEILVPACTFFATILPMRLFGYVPVFVDVNPKTATIDVEHARKQLTANTRAIIPMHARGLPCEMDGILAFAREKGLMVCEDAAHAHGAKYRGKPIGTLGEMSIFSFQNTKPLPTMEGGMGMYQKREHYERAAVFGHYDLPGSLPKDSPYARYTGTGLGLKFRMHPVSAAIGRKQLETLDARNKLIVDQVRRLNDRITQLPGLTEPACPKGVDRVYYENNTLFVDERKAGFTRAALLKALQAEGVRAKSGDYATQHRNKVYSEAKWWHHPPQIPTRLPGVEQVNSTAVNMPLFTTDAPELVEQYGVAFEKVWAHRAELAKV